jgi:hypothetical protein
MKLGGVSAFRVVSVSIAFARVAKQASQRVQSSFSTGSFNSPRSLQNVPFLGIQTTRYGVFLVLF